MPRRSSYPRSTRRGRPRRATEWFDSLIQVNALSANGQSGVTLDSNFSQPNRKGATVVRMLLDLNFQAATVDVNLQVGLGIYLCEGDARASTIFSDPFAADEQPGWLYRNNLGVFTTNLFAYNESRQLEKDVRTKRRYQGEDQHLMLILERDAAVGDVNVQGLLRVLIAHS